VYWRFITIVNGGVSCQRLITFKTAVASGFAYEVVGFVVADPGKIYLMAFTPIFEVPEMKSRPLSCETASTSVNPGFFSSLDQKVLIGICCFTRIPGLVALLPLK
jgi:hypothetical protein